MGDAVGSAGAGQPAVVARNRFLEQLLADWRGGTNNDVWEQLALSTQQPEDTQAIAEDAARELRLAAHDDGRTGEACFLGVVLARLSTAGGGVQMRGDACQELQAACAALLGRYLDFAARVGGLRSSLVPDCGLPTDLALAAAHCCAAARAGGAARRARGAAGLTDALRRLAREEAPRTKDAAFQLACGAVRAQGLRLGEWLAAGDGPPRPGGSPPGAGSLAPLAAEAAAAAAEPAARGGWLVGDLVEVDGPPPEYKPYLVCLVEGGEAVVRGEAGPFVRVPLAALQAFCSGAPSAPAAGADLEAHFSTLGLEPIATDSEAFKPTIRDAFKALALEHHPDKGGDPEKFKAISESCGALLGAAAAAAGARPAPLPPSPRAGGTAASPKARCAPPATRAASGTAPDSTSTSPLTKEEPEAPPATSPQPHVPEPAPAPAVGRFYLAACGGRRGVVEVKSSDAASGSVSVQWYVPYRNPRVGGEACLRKARQGEAQVQAGALSLSRGPIALDRAKRLPAGVAAAFGQGRARRQGDVDSTPREAQAAAAEAATAATYVSKRRRVDKSGRAASTDIPPHELSLNQLAQLIWKFAFY